MLDKPKPRPTIVLIDDDPAVLSALAFALELDGFAVRTYSSGAAALKDRDFPAESCLVVDYGMPGMNGLDLIERMRERGIASPAILITGHAARSIRDRAAVEGIPVVEKPFLTNELTTSLRKVLCQDSPSV